MERAREFQKKIYFGFIDCAKAFDCVDHNKLDNFKEMGVPEHHTCLLKNLYAGQEQLEPDMQQWTVSKLGKEYDKAVYYHPAYLTYTLCTHSGWSTSWIQDCQVKY